MNPTTINRLVAERVMGWTVSEDPRCEPPLMYREKRDGTIWYAGGCPLWNPALDMNQAMEVLDKMSTTTKETWTLFYCSTGAVAEFHYEGGREVPWKFGVHTGESENMSTAICLAALRAVGVPEEEVNRE